MAMSTKKYETPLTVSHKSSIHCKIPIANQVDVRSGQVKCKSYIENEMNIFLNWTS